MANKLNFKEYVDPKKTDKDYVRSVDIILNPSANGGEAVILSVDYYDNGDKEDNIYTTVRINAMCYGSHETQISFGDIDLDVLLQAVNKLVDMKRGF